MNEREADDEKIGLVFWSRLSDMCEKTTGVAKLRGRGTRNGRRERRDYDDMR